VSLDSNGGVADRRKSQALHYIDDIGGIPLDMVLVPAGSFTMGSTRLPEQKPMHKVKVSLLYIGKYEVTQAQWRAVASLPKVQRALKPDPSWFKGDNLPVEQVSWYDAIEFCARLSKATGRTYRLPSEAEWEYACRAGTSAAFGFGETIAPDLANYDGTYPYGSGPKGTDREQTLPVGSLGIANGFGLYDMHGNVAEWCLDLWHDNYAGAPGNGSAWLAGGLAGHQIYRGGSWFDGAAEGRAAVRGSDKAKKRANDIGFRVVAVAGSKRPK
jgi:formylglycine-generating enzyme required for sulfatase activity